MQIQMMPGELLHSAHHNNYELAAVVRLFLPLQDQLPLWPRLAR
jgi:hypothetical protein